MAQYAEGQVAYGPNGQQLVYRNGKWRSPEAKQGGGMLIGGSNPKLPGELRLQSLEERAKELQIRNAILEAQKKERELANDPNQPFNDPNDTLTGDAYLAKLPRQQAEQVRALADGRMAFPTGKAAASPYWQKMLSAVAHYDPTFDAVNFQARQQARKDFTSGKSAQNIRALNTAIGHVGQLSDQIEGTASHGGFPFATTVNAIENAARRGYGDSGPTNFDQTRSAVASELTQVFRGSGGAEADVKRYLEELSSNASLEQKRAAVRNIAGLLNSRLSEIGDQYNKAMGKTTDPVQLLNPHAQQIWNNILGPEGGNDGGGQPPHGGSDGGPRIGGGPSDGMDRSTRYLAQQAGDLQTSVATGNGQTFDPVTAGAIEQMIRKGKTPDQIAAAFPNQKFDPAQISAAQAYLKTHPKYSGFVNVTKPQNLTGWEKLSASPLAATLTGIGSAVPFRNQAAAGLSSLTGNDYETTRDRLFANEQALSDLHPGYYGTGQLAGNAGLLFAGPEALLRQAPTLAGTRFARPALEATFGAVHGAGENPDNPLLGALKEGGLTVAGAGAGRLLAVPAGAAYRGARGLFGRSGPSPITRGESAVVDATNRAGLSNVQGQLGEAARLGVPMAPVDVDPALTKLGGSAVRYSDNADRLAQDVFGNRMDNRIGRFRNAVENNLGPTGNVDQLRVDMMRDASAKAGPLYQQAYAQPGASSVNLEDLASRPGFKSGLGYARKIAAEEGRDPTTLGFDLTPEGEVTLNRVPSWQTLDYVKRGMDAALEADGRNPLTGKLQLDTYTRALNDTKNTLLNRLRTVNTTYGKALDTYAGEAQARDAIDTGRGAWNPQISPNGVGMQVASDTGNLPFMQLGSRDSLLNRAGNMGRGNPFSLFNPENVQQKLGELYPFNPANTRLLHTAKLETGLDKTASDVLGNSKTAARNLADQQFAESDVPSMALDAGVNLLTGQVPTGLVLKKGSISALKGAWQMGVGKRAVQKADEMAPLLFNTDPQAASDSIGDLVQRALAHKNYVDASRAPFRLGLAPIGGSVGILSTR